MSLRHIATPAIEFREVSISFDDIRALQQVSLVLHTGEMICITGDSRSGKSVLLRLALGLFRPDEGEVLINGRDITRMEEPELLALRRETMGMVFQENSVFTGRSVYENAAYRLEDSDWPEDQIQSAVVEVLTFVGLEEETEKQAEELSGGMKRRLDPINARQVLDLIIRARDCIAPLLSTSLRRSMSSHTLPGTAHTTTGAPLWCVRQTGRPACMSASLRKAEWPSSAALESSSEARCRQFNICSTR
jgi:ABC-type ATPase involved in cell division